MDSLVDTSIGFLLERLRWPLPRVRWEAARSISLLVRKEEDGVLNSLIEWTSNQVLESECLLGLSVIHAFELGDFCTEDAAKESVSRPSLVSDWMIKNVYHSHDRSGPFRYSISLPQDARIDRETAALFDRFNTVAIPPIFLHTVEMLEHTASFSFLERWRHDFEWICRSHDVRTPSVSFFLHTGTGSGGTFHTPLGEMFISAYLRMLAYSIHIGRLRTDEAEHHALLALPLNRGLPTLKPRERPRWSRDLHRRWLKLGDTLIKDLWVQSKASVRDGEIPAALRFAEADDEDFIEIDIDLVVGQDTFQTRTSAAKSLSVEWVDADCGSMKGHIRLYEPELQTLRTPLRSTCLVIPEHVGRIDATIALNVRLACIGLGLQHGRVSCNEDEIELKVRDDVVSRWCFWYADWEPWRYVKQSSDLSSVATVQRTWLRRTSDSLGLSFALLARVRTGKRANIHEDHAVDETSFWIRSEDFSIL